MRPESYMDTTRLLAFLKSYGFSVLTENEVVAGLSFGIGSVFVAYLQNGWSIQAIRADGSKNTFVDLYQALAFLTM